MSRVPPVVIALMALAVPACATSSGHPLKQADGGYQLTCKGPLARCLKHAERLCLDAGYRVTSARDTHEVLGHPSGQSQVVIQSSNATIYCGASGPPTERPMIELKREPPLEPPPTLSAPPRGCVPGATQTCVGPAGCAGGQACASDGSRFESCDCGPAPAASPAPPLSPPAPLP